MTDFYSQNRCVCSTRSHGPLLCAFCLSFHFNIQYNYVVVARYWNIRGRVSDRNQVKP